MQKKIYQSTILILTISMLIFGIIFEYLGYLLYRNECQKELQSIANITLQYQQEPDSISETLNSVLDYQVRITFIDFNGNVVYDNIADASTIESHSKRNEFIESIKNGIDEDIRQLEYINENTYYYAIKQNDGVIIFSRTIEILSVFISMLPIIILAFGVITIVVTIFSMNLAEKIMQPITTLVSQFDIFNKHNEELPKKIITEYSELEPIAETIQTLVNRIQKYIQNIREQKDRIRLITDNMVEGMIILDEKNDILSINKSAIKILNPNFKVRENRMFLELTRNKILLDALDDIKEEKNIKEIITIKDSYYKAYISWAENIRGTIILLVDVTETVKAEEVRRDFSANVSHELKTPLTTIKGFGELFENGLLTDIADVKKYGAMIERESERLLFLINDIIRLSEIEEKTEKVLTPINLYDSSEYAINLLRQKAKNKNILITLNSPKDIMVNAHNGYMNELLINLIDNAIKYNKDNGSIKISLLEDDKKVTILVVDTGIGISKQDCSRIFERFYRVDKSHSKKIGGTGLGLSIVKHIVNYHNGEIHLQSELGVGTTISIDIPKT